MDDSSSTCQLLFEGYFPPCCTPSVGNTHELYILAGNFSFSTTYHSNGTNCSRLLVPYQTELQDAVLNATDNSLQVQLGIGFTGNDYIFNYTANVTDLLCEANYTTDIPLPDGLNISMVDNPCTSVNFVINYSSKCYLFSDGVQVYLGNITCNITSINQTHHELVVNCSVMPFADLRNLTVFISSKLSPAHPDLMIVNYCKMEGKDLHDLVERIQEVVAYSMTTLTKTCFCVLTVLVNIIPLPTILSLFQQVKINAAVLKTTLKPASLCVHQLKLTILISMCSYSV